MVGSAHGLIPSARIRSRCGRVKEPLAWSASAPRDWRRVKFFFPPGGRLAVEPTACCPRPHRRPTASSLLGEWVRPLALSSMFEVGPMAPSCLDDDQQPFRPVQSPSEVRSGPRSRPGPVMKLPGRWLHWKSCGKPFSCSVLCGKILCHVHATEEFTQCVCVVQISLLCRSCRVVQP